MGFVFCTTIVPTRKLFAHDKFYIFWDFFSLLYYIIILTSIHNNQHNINMSILIYNYKQTLGHIQFYGQTNKHRHISRLALLFTILARDNFSLKIWPINSDFGQKFVLQIQYSFQ